MSDTGRCHSNCERYAAYRSALDDAKQDLRENMVTLGADADKYTIEKAMHIREIKERMKRYQRKVHRDI